jgi:hypothetical protein
MIFNLNPATEVKVTEDTRIAKTPVAVAVSATAVPLLAANSNRGAYSIYNPGPATVFVREGAVVTATLYDFQIPAGYYWKEDFPGSPRYLGAIAGITASGTSTVLVAEGNLA